MTVGVTFYAERALLRFVKQSLDAHPSDLPVEVACVCVLASAAALEASVNSFFVNDGRLEHYDELTLLSKIETLADWSKLAVNWGHRPWQDVKQLLRIRNWLAHFKDPYIGLARSLGGWVDDVANTPPKIDPFVELSRSRIHRYREGTIAAIQALAKALYPTSSEELSLEDGELFLVG